MKSVLKRYESVSGQAVNFNKSSITFSPNTNVKNRRLVCEALKVGEVVVLGKYLGIPMTVEKRKNEVFGFLSDRNCKSGEIRQCRKQENTHF